jgi:hypothetical protein
VARTRGPKPRPFGAFGKDESYLSAIYEMVTAAPQLKVYAAAMAVIDENTPGHTGRHGKAVRLKGKFKKYRRYRDQQQRSFEPAGVVALISPDQRTAWAKALADLRAAGIALQAAVVGAQIQVAPVVKAWQAWQKALGRPPDGDTK